MSMHTQLTLLRRDSRITVSDDDMAELNDSIAATLKAASENRESIRRYADEGTKGLDIGSRNEEDVDNSVPRFVYIDSEHYADTTDSSMWVKITEQSFSSSFTELSEMWQTSYMGEKSQQFISASDARELNSACRYLLNGVYDAEIEDIIGDRFIRLLGETLPSYGGRFRKKRDTEGLCLFVEKSDGGGWKVTDSRYEWYDGDSDESEIEGRCILQRLVDITGAYLDEINRQYDYKNNKRYDVVLMLTVN